MAAAPPSHSRIADAARSAAAGSVAGASVSAVLQPFDTLRTRLQADATTGTARPVGATLRAIAAEGHGVSSLWRGSTATVLRVGGGAGLHFFSLQLLRGAAAGGSGQRPQWVGDAAMGGTARAVAVFAMCPLTTVKTRMEARRRFRDREPSTPKTLPRHFRDDSETLPRHFRDTSETLPRRRSDTSETPDTPARLARSHRTAHRSVSEVSPKVSPKCLRSASEAPRRRLGGVSEASRKCRGALLQASGAAASRFSYASVPEALASISRREGVRALWRGVPPEYR